MTTERHLNYRARCSKCDWTSEATDPVLKDWVKSLAYDHASSTKHTVGIYIKREIYP